MAIDGIKDPAAAYAELLRQIEPHVRKKGTEQTAQLLRAEGVADSLPVINEDGEHYQVPLGLNPEGQEANQVRSWAQAIRKRWDRKAKKSAADAIHQMQRGLNEATTDDNPAFSFYGITSIVEGLEALKGTDLEGIVPDSYVETLKDRWREETLEYAGGPLSRLLGEAPTGVLMIKQTMPEALKGLSERLKKEGYDGNQKSADAAILVASLWQMIPMVSNDRKLDPEKLDMALQLANAALESDEVKGLDSTLVGTFRFFVRELRHIGRIYPNDAVPLITDEEKDKLYLQNPLYL